MDKNVLDFWGDLFINAAKTQEQLEEMAGWTQKILNSLTEWSACFLKFPAPKTARTESSSSFEAWSKMGEECQKLFVNACLKSWGIEVDPWEQLDLIRRYEELKEKVASQEETIRHLRLLLKEAKRGTQNKDGLRLRESIPEMDIQWNRAPSSFQT